MTPVNISKYFQTTLGSSRKMEQTYFSLFLPLRTTKNPGHYIYISNRHKDALKGEEKKGLATDLETQGMILQ